MNPVDLDDLADQLDSGFDDMYGFVDRGRRG